MKEILKYAAVAGVSAVIGFKSCEIFDTIKTSLTVYKAIEGDEEQKEVIQMMYDFGQKCDEFNQKLDERKK